MPEEGEEEEVSAVRDVDVPVLGERGGEGGDGRPLRYFACCKSREPGGRRG